MFKFSNYLAGWVVISWSCWVTAEAKISLAIDVAPYKYEETVHGQHFMDDKAVLLGLTGIVPIVERGQPYNHRVFFRLQYGEAHYNGGITRQNPDGSTTMLPLQEDGHQEYLFRLEDTLEYHLPKSIVTPFVGLGMRVLFDDPPRFNDGGDYVRQSIYLYMPFGIEIKPKLATQLPGVRLAAQYLLKGRQKSFLRTPELTNYQHHGFGLTLETSFTWQYDKTQVITLVPYDQYWHILDSDIASTQDFTGSEPNNYTNQIGIRIEMQV